MGIDDIGEYPMIYLPYPEMLRKATADKLRDYVAKGGKLVSEGCPGYFGDGGTVGAVQPNLGLDQVFGARETYVQFTPDLLGKLTLTVRDKQIGGQYFLQEYKLAGGQAAGQYANGHIAAVEHTFGSGKTLLIGTFPGGSYYRNHAAGTREFFAGLLAWAGIRQQVQSSDAAVKARLHKGAGGTYVWVVNPTRTARNVKISLPSPFQRAVELWQESSRPAISGNTLAVSRGGSERGGDPAGIGLSIFKPLKRRGGEPGDFGFTGRRAPHRQTDPPDGSRGLCVVHAIRREIRAPVANLRARIPPACRIG